MFCIIDPKFRQPRVGFENLFIRQGSALRMTKSVNLAFQTPHHTEHGNGLFNAEDWLPEIKSFAKSSLSIIPGIAKDQRLIKKIETILPKLPTKHEIYNVDARNSGRLK